MAKFHRTLALLLFLLFILHPLEIYAEARGPDGARPSTAESEHRSGDSITPQSDIAPSIDLSLYSEAATLNQSFQHFSVEESGEIFSALAKKLRYAPYLLATPNRGSLQTNFTIPLPPNFSALKSLTFAYDSQNEEQGGYGVGWSLDLPYIDLSVRGNIYAPYFVRGLSSAELIEKINDPLLNQRVPFVRALLNRSPLRNVTISSFHSFIPVVDETHIAYTIMRDREGEVVAFLAMTLAGTQYLFNGKGQLVYVCDQLSRPGVGLTWSGGLVREIYEGAERSHGRWVLNFNYYKQISNQNSTESKTLFLKKWSHGEFSPSDLLLNSITSIHTESGQQIRQFFYYDSEGYLTSAYTEGGVMPLFQGEYSKMGGDEKKWKEAANDLTEKEEHKSYHFDVNNHLALITSDPKSSQQEIYLDLNNDRIIDKVVFDFTNKNRYIETSIEPNNFFNQYQNVINANGHLFLPREYQYNITFDKLSNAFSSIGTDESKTQIKFYLGKINNSGEIEFIPGEIYPVGNELVEPYYYKVSSTVKKGNPIRGHAIFYKIPVLNTFQNSIKFIDMNGDNRKDLVYCEGTEEYALENIKDRDPKTTISPLIAGMIKRMRPDLAEAFPFPINFRGEKVPDPFDYGESGRRQKTYYQEIYLREEASLPLTDIRELSFSGQKVGTSTESLLAMDQEYKCNANSIFFDFNGDGIIDVLTGSDLYLRGKNQILKVKLSSEDLPRIFGDIVGPNGNGNGSELDPLQFDFFYTDLNGDHKLDLVQGLSLEQNPQSGEQLLFFRGKTVTIIPERVKKLTKLFSPYEEGIITISYAFQNGVWVTKEINRGIKRSEFDFDREAEERTRFLARVRHTGEDNPRWPSWYIDWLNKNGIHIPRYGSDDGVPWTPRYPNPRPHLPDLLPQLSRFSSEKNLNVTIFPPIFAPPAFDETSMPRSYRYDPVINFHESRVQSLSSQTSYKFYNAKIDPFTGYFIGFSSSKDDRKIHTHIPKLSLNLGEETVTTTRSFNSADTILNSRYLSRNILSSKLSKVETSYHGIGSSYVPISTTTYRWANSPGENSEIYPLLLSETTLSYENGELSRTNIKSYTYSMRSGTHTPALVQTNIDGKITNKKFDFNDDYYLSYPVEEEIVNSNREKLLLFYDNPTLLPGVVTRAQLGHDNDNKRVTKDFFHDNFGRIIKITSQNGAVEERRYLEESPLVLTTTTSALGTSSASYNELTGNITSLTTPLGAKISKSYSSDGVLISQKITSPYEVEIYSLVNPLMSCNPAGRCTRPLTVEQQVAGEKIFWELDEFGRITAKMRPLGENKKLHYDIVTYDQEDNVLVNYVPYIEAERIVTKPRGEFTYVPLASQTERFYAERSDPYLDQEDMAADEFSWPRVSSYHELGNNLKIEKETEFALDKIRKVIHHTYGPRFHEVAVNSYTPELTQIFDDKGVLISTTQNGHSFTFDYSDLLELIGIKELALAWEYDYYGKVQTASKASAPASRSVFDYDTVENYVLNKTTGLRLNFDSANRPLSTAKENPDFTDILETFTYRGPVLTEHLYKNGSDEIFAEHFTYDQLGRLTEYNFNDLKEIYTYDKYGKVLSYSLSYGSEELFTHSYAYAAGALKSISPIISNISYDSSERLVAVNYQAEDLSQRFHFAASSGPLRKVALLFSKWGVQFYEETYLYSSYGQLASRNLTIGSDEIAIAKDSFTYNEKTHALSSEILSPAVAATAAVSRKLDGTANLTYDENGRTTKIETDQLAWSGDNLKSVGGQTIYYDYRGEFKAACPGKLRPTKDNISRCTIKINDTLYLVRGEVIKLITTNGRPVGVYVGGEFYTLVSDHLSSVRAVFKNRELMFRREYSAYGFKTVTLGENQGEEAKALEEKIPFSFAGLIELPGLNQKNVSGDRAAPAYYWSKSRVYSPNVRKWLSKDSYFFENPRACLASPLECDLYSYAINDPVNLVDPSGTDTYLSNRKIKTDKAEPWDSSKLSISHTFVFITKFDSGKEYVDKTFSWGNDGKSWTHANHKEDMLAAKTALNSGWAQKVGLSDYDTYVEKAYFSLQKEPVEDHLWVPWNNCKHAADRLLNDATSNYKIDQILNFSSSLHIDEK